MVAEVVAIWQSPLRLVMHLLMMGLLGSWVQTALMVQRKRAGIATANDVVATGVSGIGAGTETETGIASTSGGSGVVNEAGMRLEVGVGVARTTG